MNPRICPKSPDGRHNFPPGGDCLNGCGMNQTVLSGGLKPLSQTERMQVNFNRALTPRKAPKGIHSELHEFIAKARKEFGETATKGKGSFSFYLGILKRVPLQLCYQWLGDCRTCKTKESACKRFWWHYKQWKTGGTSPPEK